MPIQTVAIFGVGLIGGSFALALRARGFSGKILGVSSPRTIRAALGRGVIDAGASLREAVPQADLVYLSQPISKILDSLPHIRELAKPAALITDAGSTKREIVEKAGRLFTENPSFLGGHPMAGREKRGVELADPDLFDGATYVLTPTGGVLPETAVVSEFVGWLDRMGARTVVLPAGEHDRVVTWTSHLPQLVSSALAASIAEHLGAEHNVQVAGPALRDMTRLAESPYDIWKDIFGTNRANIEQALRRYIRHLQQLQQDLGGPLTRQEFEKACQFRKNL